MYSLILMTAMAGSGDVASFGWRTGCSGCTGAPVATSCSGYACTGYACSGYSCSGYSCSGYSCSGSSCSGYSCSGYSCSGCTGGGPMFPRLRSFFSGFHNKSCTGCTGCTGYSASCYGCSGATVSYGCSGYSCHGSAYAGSSCYGSCAGYSTGVVYGGCYGSGVVSGYSEVMPTTTIMGTTSHYGTLGVISETVVPAPATAMPATGETPKSTDKPAETEKPKGEGKTTSNAGTAHLALVLPVDAKLFVDGQVITGQGERRQFHTPELAAGQAYFYEFTAEFTVNGKREVESKKVVVRAGDSLTESFTKLIAAAKTPTTPVVASR